MASILKVDTIQDQSGNNIINENADTITIGASGDTITVPTGASLTVPNGGLSGQNYPAFEAYLGSDQTLSSGVTTKVNINTEVYDTNGYYDNVTNYRFTPLVAGNYFVYAGIKVQTSTEYIRAVTVGLYKNGSGYKLTEFNTQTHTMITVNLPINAVVAMNGSTDYLEVFVTATLTAGTPRCDTGTKQCYLGAYRIGA